MKSSNVGCCTVAGAVLVALKLCGQIDNTPWFIVLLPWTFDVVATAIAAFYFERKLAKEDREMPDEDLDDFIDTYVKVRDKARSARGES